MFAGPHGSGKSVLKSYLPPKLLGVYLNPDEIQRDIEMSGFLDLGVFGVLASAEGIACLVILSVNIEKFKKFDLTNAYLNCIRPANCIYR
jgi:hypothetical protein